MQILAKKWEKPGLPGKILAIRLQAMGDTIITLPYLQALKRQLPQGTIIHFLTRKEVEAVPRNIQLFDRVFSLGGGRDEKKQMLHAMLMLPELWLQRYDVVADLQNNRLSRFIRKALRTSAWTEFDRFSPIPAGERTRLAIEALGLGPASMDTNFKLNGDEGERILQENGWDQGKKIIILNPAGAFETRNWEMDKYARLARMWMEMDQATQFLVLGTRQIEPKARFLKERLGADLINLVAQTNPFEAFAIIQKASLMITEDSGLMHMAWVSGVPVLAIFGSTRSDWSRPLGEKSMLLDSSDLECGNCMREVCLFGDNRCLTRYSPEWILEKAMQLIH